MIKNIMKPVAVALMFSAVGCNSFNVDITNETLNEESTEYQITVNETFFDSKDEIVFSQVDLMNMKMAGIVDSLINDTKGEAVQFFSAYTNPSRRNRQSRPAFKYELLTKDTVFTCNSKLISTQIVAYVFSGGAHGKTEYYSFNYSPQTLKFLGIDDILNLQKSDAINVLLEKYMKNPEGCFTDKPTIDKVKTVNISPQTVLFTFEHYVLGPYACGACIIEVPISELKDIFKL